MREGQFSAALDRNERDSNGMTVISVLFLPQFLNSFLYTYNMFIKFCAICSVYTEYTSILYIILLLCVHTIEDSIPCHASYFAPGRFEEYDELHQDDMKNRMNSSFSSNHPGAK